MKIFGWIPLLCANLFFICLFALVFFWLLFDVVAVVIAIADADFFWLFLLLLYIALSSWSLVMSLCQQRHCNAISCRLNCFSVCPFFIYLFIMLFVFFNSFSSLACVCVFCCFLLARNICLFDFWSHILVRVHTEWKTALKSSSWTSVQAKDFSVNPLQFNNNRSLFRFCCNSIEITSIYCFFVCLYVHVFDPPSLMIPERI